jgi:hypothetical protein
LSRRDCAAALALTLMPTARACVLIVRQLEQLNVIGMAIVNVVSGSDYRLPAGVECGSRAAGCAAIVVCACVCALG